MKALCFSTPLPALTARARRATCAPRMVVGEAVTPGVSIVAGSIALVMPTFVAAVLFGERIVRQRRCTECNGSGLVPVEPDSEILRRCTKYVPVPRAPLPQCATDTLARTDAAAFSPGNRSAAFSPDETKRIYCNCELNIIITDLLIRPRRHCFTRESADHSTEARHDMADSSVNPDELMARIQAQVNAQMGEAFREQVTSKCFTICVPSPSKSLTTRESACLDKCLDRFVEAMNLVTQALANRSNRGM